LKAICCFLELIRQEFFPADALQQKEDFLDAFKLRNPIQISPIGLSHVNLKQESAKLRPAPKKQEQNTEVDNSDLSTLLDLPFGHLHNHTQFSIL